MRIVFALSVIVALSACSSAGHSDNHDLAGGGGGGGGSDLAMTGGGMIPDPGAGNAVDNNFGSVEPNDTPSQATPLGTSTSTMGLHIWVTNNSIGGNDTADYFVFKSGPGGGPFTFNICFGAPITSMSATLWQVQNGQQINPPIHSWNSTQQCVVAMAGDVTLLASTEYLFGVTAVGGAGMYGA